MAIAKKKKNEKYISMLSIYRHIEYILSGHMICMSLIILQHILYLY